MRPLATEGEFQQNSHTVAIMQQRLAIALSQIQRRWPERSRLAVENFALCLKSAKEPVQSQAIAN